MMVLKILAAVVFFLFLFWMRRRQQANSVEIQRLKSDLSETQEDLERSQSRLQHVVGLLNALHEHKVSPIGQVSWQTLYDFAVQTAGRLINAETVVLLKWDAKYSDYRGVAAQGLSPQRLVQLQIRVGEGVLGRAAQTAKMQSSQGPTETLGLAEDDFLVTPYLILPLWVHSQVYGLLVFCRFKDAIVSPDATRLAVLMAKHLELTMENLDLHEDRTRVYAELISSLSHALSAKDPGGQRHADHCRKLIQAMAKEMHLPDMLTEQLEYGAVLHDVGKLGLSDTLLLKAGPLTEDEYAKVKSHAAIGADILHNVDFLKAVAPIVRYHHEWVNGQGYPEGLAGEEIPLGARMVSIVDAWDTMTTDQPYRPALNKNNAIAELRQQAGTQFDPKLVDVFVHVVDKLEPNV